jgi:hypothetical protein
VLDVNEKGDADYSGAKPGLQVSDLIGRAVVLYPNTDLSQVGTEAAVIARSAGVGQNYKQLCSCDGTVIWEATNNDFVNVYMFLKSSNLVLLYYHFGPVWILWLNLIHSPICCCSWNSTCTLFVINILCPNKFRFYRSTDSVSYLRL